MITLKLKRRTLRRLVEALEVTVPTACRNCGKQIIRCPLCNSWTTYDADPDYRYGGLSFSDTMKSPFHLHKADSLGHMPR